MRTVTLATVSAATFASALFLFFTPEKDELRHVTVADLEYNEEGSVIEKKKRFFAFLGPIVAAENHRIRDQRERLIEALRTGDDDFVQTMRTEYELEDDESTETLLRRVDVVPVELALVQGANESMWGRSRFAREGNNLFGQWCFREGCGVIPLRREAGKSHEVASFDTVNESVKSYLKNINTHPAYRKLRDIRAQLRKEGRNIDPLVLAQGLAPYSERGGDYVKELREMIRINRDLMEAEVYREFTVSE